MAQLFLGSEICEMAIETERKGEAFYQAAATAAKSPAVSDFCLRMAAAEKEHEATFKAMLALVARYESSDSYSDEYLDYVNALLQHDVMPSAEAGRKLAQEAKSEAEAVDFAMQFEKSTILFLFEMKNFVPEQERDTVEKLIDEERSHLAGLAKLRKTLKP